MGQKVRDWRLLADIGRQLQVPLCTVAAMRPGMFLYSECVYFIELTIPFEDVIEEPFARKKLQCAELVAEARHTEDQWR